MSLSLNQRILDREISSTLSRRRAYRDLYGDRQLVKDLDIVHELDGHSGCVNALSWSKTGRLLASGSDDQHLNIHVYQPEDSDKQFQLHTTVATGHSQNIFSVKFMPESNDRIVVTCAGDNDVRVFDLEYQGKSTEPSPSASRATAVRGAAPRTRNNVYNGVRYLSDGNTNARVYRSHGDRVKRIVTESSPYLFLTCSEDGEVRQWDTRLPSSAYPRSSTGRYMGVEDNVPPPLISYQNYHLDLNTISCSPSQPHYIALGGRHLHCFLHDRRMIGRDRMRESGSPGFSTPSLAARDEEMDKATRCVRKFAPRGSRIMTRQNEGHITACKISDARPDEMVVSWSGDYIYSFDLIRSPDAEEPIVQDNNSPVKKRSRWDVTAEQKQRSLADDVNTIDNAAALRINYRNGQHEVVRVTDELLTPAQTEAQRITRALLKVHKTFFGHTKEHEDSTARFTQTLNQCAVLLSDIDEIIRAWRYPGDPTAQEVTEQQELRSVRAAARRFVQAAGTISRVLGGTLRTATGDSPLLEDFLIIHNRMTDLKLAPIDAFYFDFLKAILVWLDSGRGRLIEAFTRPSGVSKTARAAYRLPIAAEEATSEAVEEQLTPYLQSLLDDNDEVAVTPILDPEKSRFEVDAARQLFADEYTALSAFKDAVSQPFADLSSETTDDKQDVLDRRSAIEFWALRVARGVLLKAFERIGLHLVEKAFGGISTVSHGEILESTEWATVDEEDEDVEMIEMIDAGTEASVGNGSAPSNERSGSAMTHDYDMDEDNDDDDYFDEEYPSEIEYDSENDSDPDEEDGVPNLGRPRLTYRTDSRERHRVQAASGVPCYAATRTYKGHCNVRTVKDVNYFGLEDEYVVSGSDDGNVFIWDRKTCKLVNILEGDGEVVNVVQGHPYETMLAVSGIDSTIKIFSPDNRARHVARLGEEVIAHDATQFSSLEWSNQHGGQGRRPRESQGASIPAFEDDDDKYVAESGLASRRRMNQARQIMRRNEVNRHGDDNDQMMTRSMLHHLAQRLRAQRTGQGGDPNAPLAGLETIEDEDGNVRVVLREDCAMM